MGLLQTFKNWFLKDAVLFDEKDGLNFLKDKDAIYIIADSNKGSIISEAVKSTSLKSFSSNDKENFFITLLNTREDFAKFSNEICWDSYVWIATEPNHTIHFDSRPTLKPRTAKA